MKLSDFDYDLPESAIADRPPTKRGSTRLLTLGKDSGKIEDRLYADLPELLNPEDLVIINNTKVIPARLKAETETGGQRELLLLEKHGEQNDLHSSLVMYRRKLHAGQTIKVGTHEVAVEETFGNGTARISAEVNIWDLAEEAGSIPLPPYMHREADESDKERYQTVFAKETGSVAAPTASLNLTDEILARIRAKGTGIHEITLHVGLGTFMPIRTDDIEEHEMHSEYFVIPKNTAEAIRKTRKNGGRIVAVGTTVVRTLEFNAERILQKTGPLHGEANIFIYPGYDFKLVDVMVTNFHAPHSTVLMMAAAFASWDHLKNAYQHALNENYKFLSYGDSMLIY